MWAVSPEDGLYGHRRGRRPAPLPQRKDRFWRVIEVVTLVKFAKALRCSVDQLLAGLDRDYDRMLGTAGRFL